MNATQPRAPTLTLFAAATFLAGALGASSSFAATTAQELDREAEQALENLVEQNSFAREVAAEATAVLIFPSIVKAGLVFGGAYGEGVLTESDTVIGYYNSVSASWGLQAGAQSYSYVVFLMNADAVDYLDESDGWEIGVGPTVVVVNEGLATNLSTSTLKDDAYAFIFDQQGAMASLSIEGTKITRIEP